MWSKLERGKYVSQAKDYEPLRKLYEAHGLPETDPEARAKFLAEDVLQVTMTDHDLLMRTASYDGRAASLVLLEDMVIANHKEKIERCKAEITVPLDERLDEYTATIKYLRTIKQVFRKKGFWSAVGHELISTFAPFFGRFNRFNNYIVWLCDDLTGDPLDWGETKECNKNIKKSRLKNITNPNLLKEGWATAYREF